MQAWPDYGLCIDQVVSFAMAHLTRDRASQLTALRLCPVPLTPAACAVLTLGDVLEHICAKLSTEGLHALRASCRALRSCPAVLGSVVRATVDVEPDDIDLGLAQQMRSLKQVSIQEPASLGPLVPHLLSLTRLTRVFLSAPYDFSDDGASIPVLTFDLQPLSSLLCLREVVLFEVQLSNLHTLSQISRLDLVGVAGTAALAALSQLQALEISEQEDVAQLQSLSQLSRLSYGLGVDREAWEENALVDACDALQSVRSLCILENGLEPGRSLPAAVHQLCRLTQLRVLYLHVFDEDMLVGGIDLSMLPLRRLAFVGIRGSFPAITAPSVTCLYLRYLTAPPLPDITACHRLTHLHLILSPGLSYRLSAKACSPQLVQICLSPEDSTRLLVQPGARVQVVNKRITFLVDLD